MSTGEWCLIESDPGVFSELVRGFGAQGVQVEELWSLAEECFKALRPMHGLIFLFKHSQDDAPTGQVLSPDQCPGLFFAKQVITNSCATQAILSILLNCPHADLDIGSVLAGFKDFSCSFDYYMRGLTLTNSTEIRNVHNSFARQEIIESVADTQSKKEASYHFISYLPFEGYLYELDGLRDGPIRHGAIPEGSDWLDVARETIEERMHKLMNDNIDFNLMAVVSDRKLHWEREIKKLEASGRPSIELDYFKEELAAEEGKRKRFQVETVRRKHNYIPFIVELMKILGKEGHLTSLMQKSLQAARGSKQEN